MIHVDVKKLGQIPAGGGWRLHGRDATSSVANRHKKTTIGYDYVHTAIDDHTRLAYSEIHPDENEAPWCFRTVDLLRFMSGTEESSVGTSP